MLFEERPNFEENIIFKNRFKFANDAKTLIDIVLDHEFITSISKIYITYSLESLSAEASNIKKYLEFKLRYFNQVELVLDSKNLIGISNLNGIGLYIG